MANKIERKFLVKELPKDLQIYPYKEITQGYLMIDEDREVRLRRMDDKFFWTVKEGKGVERYKNEIEITREEYDLFWQMVRERKLEKTRFEIPNEGEIIELDVYRMDLSGLIVAEVEFKDGIECNDFVVPRWFGKEVTDDARYKNKNLVINGIPKD